MNRTARRAPRRWGAPRTFLSILVPFALLLGACLPATGQAAPIVQLHTSFTPDRLGAATTIGFGFTIRNPDGTLPPPLRHIELRIPSGINYVNTTLGLVECHAQRLVEKGLTGCSPNSRLGFGKALVEVPFGTGSGKEIPRIYALMGPSKNGNTVVLFYADGREPVYAQLVFEGELLPAGGAFSSNLSTSIPAIKSVADGPPVSILSVESTIGPQGLLYEKRVHGHVVHYHPQGVSLPEKCPRGGFRFTANFAFEDGSSTTASSTVACPKGRHRRHRRHRRHHG